MNIVATFYQISFRNKGMYKPFEGQICIFQFPTVQECDFDWRF